MTITRALTIEDICDKLRPIFGKKIDEIYFRYTVAEDKDEREEIAHVLNALYQKHLSQLLDKGVLLEPPREELIDGTYDLAKINYANKRLFSFKLREKDWPRHVCITGMSGSGKTTLAFNIIQQFIGHQKPFLVFDWKKSFRPLINADPTLMIFTVGDEKVTNLFKTNVNKPPKGVSPKEWINVLTDLLTESFSASFGVHKVILETLDEAFKEWGIYNGSENYPTWNHIKWRLEEKIQKANSREAGWIESALRIATVLTFGEFGKTVNYKGKNAFSVEDLLNKRVIMELNSLGTIEKKFFCEFVLSYIYKLRKARQNNVSQIFDHSIVVDEAHNIFLKKPTNFANESVTDMIYREMREYGTALVCLDQHISKISDTVKGNSACHIAFQQQLPQDIEDISGLMQLKEKRHFFSHLAVGTAIVKLSERYTLPFLIEVPLSNLRKDNVSDEDVKSRMQAMSMNHDFEKGVDEDFNSAIIEPEGISILPRKNKLQSEEVKPLSEANKGEGLESFSEVQKIIYEFVKGYLDAGVELSEIEKILEQSKVQGGYNSEDIIKVINKFFENRLVVTFKNGNNSNIERVNVDLTEEQRKLIEFLQNNPHHKYSTVEVYQEIGLSPRKGTKVKKELEIKGLIEAETIKYSKGWKKFLRLKNGI